MSSQNVDEDERFFESLDRLVSSSRSCSASNSDNDSDSTTHSAADEPHSGDGNRRLRSTFPAPRFPIDASRFDVWISEPESVSARRSRLLRQMGLSRQSTRSRVSPELDTEIEVSDSSQSVSSNQLIQRDQGESSRCVGGDSPIVITKSDAAVGQSGVGDCDGQYHQRNSSFSSSTSSSSSSSLLHHSFSRSILSIRSTAEIDRINPASVSSNFDNHRKFPMDDDTDDHNSDVVANGGSAAAISTLASTSNAENVERVVSTGAERLDLSEQVCTIKNLDNGKEFVVNEIQEDGTWKKLREVETGKQITMEEFETFVGHSPIVQELMRRQNVDTTPANSNSTEDTSNGSASRFKKKGSWFETIRNAASSVTGNKERRSTDDTSVEKGGRRSSSATDDSQDVSFHGPERVRVKQYGKSCKELTALYKSQEIQAHNGSIWSIKFSLDGKYLASAGEDCVIHIWQVLDAEKKGELVFDKPELLLLANGSPEPTTMSPKRKGRLSVSRKSLSLDNIMVPDSVFGLSETPICSFHGHLDDVLDLSWSKSQHLLSSSMDKTVRLWNLSSQTCLKIFSHSDYVTCIQFNPVDDRYFISGSLDAKFRIWSIEDRQVMDWYDMHEMVTAACYTPDGQAALVGSYKGTCRVYNTSDNKRQHKTQINLHNRKKKAHHRKITGFQFVPGSSSQVLVTSADSRIRVVDGVDLVCKFRGFRNTSSQISASLTADSKYVVAASEDSHVYLWKYESVPRPGRSKGVTVANSYEYFHCQDVSAAIPWPGMSTDGNQDGFGNNAKFNDIRANHPPTPVEGTDGKTNGEHTGIISSATNGYFIDRIWATWPEGKRSLGRNSVSRVSTDMSDGQSFYKSPWGLVIVTAGLKGEIRTFQNFGLPTRI